MFLCCSFMFAQKRLCDYSFTAQCFLTTGSMFIKNDLNTVCAHRINRMWRVMVCLWVQTCRGTLPFLSIFTIWFVQHLTEALIITPWGHCCSYNSWKREMDLLVSICPFVCQSSVDCCINCIPAAVGS